MMKFYKISVGGQYHIKIIVANNVFEAVGFYLITVLNGTGCIDDICYEEIPSDHKVEVSCIGFPVYKTVEEMLKEKEHGDTPSIVCGLIE